MTSVALLPSWHPKMPDGSPAKPSTWMAVRSSEIGIGSAGNKAMISDPLLSPAACGPHPPACCTQRNSAPYELGQRTSFWVAAGGVAPTLLTSAAPALTSSLFAEEWNLTPPVTTPGFATFLIAVPTI